MVNIDYKTDRIRLEMESGEVKQKLVDILHMGLKWLSIEYPAYSGITITDIYRTNDEQDQIYLNHIDSDIVKKYTNKPWQSVHQDHRGMDIRTKDMPKGMADRLTDIFNMITYDHRRPWIKTAKNHDVSKNQNAGHIHIQVVAV